MPSTQERVPLPKPTLYKIPKGNQHILRFGIVTVKAGVNDHSPWGVALICGHRPRIKGETARLRSFKFITACKASGLIKNHQASGYFEGLVPASYIKNVKSTARTRRLGEFLFLSHSIRVAFHF